MRIKFGNAPGEAVGGANYVPITIIETQDILAEALSHGKEIGEVIEGRAISLAQTLAYGEYIEIFSFAIREIIRNVIEHSKSTNMAYCAQYWPNSYFAEIAILDTGIGIRSSLSRNSKLEINDDYGALCLSLIPGISGNAHKFNTGNIWDNSGFGLYMVSRLCGNNGNFYIGSGESGLYLSSKRKERIETKYSGTILKLGLTSIAPDNLRNLITRLNKDGDEIARKYLHESNITSSFASKMLSEDIFLQKK